MQKSFFPFIFSTLLSGVISAQTYECDELNRLKSVKYGDGTVIQYELNTDADIIQVITKTPTRFDYDGDGKADLVFRRVSNKTQYFRASSDKQIRSTRFGRSSEDVPIAGDFDGDGITDFGVRRKSTQYFYIKNSSGTDFITNNSDGITRRRFGHQNDDIPVPADYDGDGKSDLAFRRPDSHTWYILNSSGVDSLTNNEDGISRKSFGMQSDDIPVPADYDGDGRADLAVWRPSNQMWYILNSTGNDAITGNSDGITRKKFGNTSSNVPVPADYDGDGRTDIAFRDVDTQTWNILNSSAIYVANSQTEPVTSREFGKQKEDIPVPADYDGDGKADLAVRRPSNLTWYILNSSGEDLLTSNLDGITRRRFALQETDIPIAAPPHILWEWQYPESRPYEPSISPEIAEDTYIIDDSGY